MDNIFITVYQYKHYVIYKWEVVIVNVAKYLYIQNFIISNIYIYIYVANNIFRYIFNICVHFTCLYLFI